jgi:hypothetical protein
MIELQARDAQGEWLAKEQTDEGDENHQNQPEDKKEKNKLATPKRKNR